MVTPARSFVSLLDGFVIKRVNCFNNLVPLVFLGSVIFTFDLFCFVFFCQLLVTSRSQNSSVSLLTASLFTGSPVFNNLACDMFPSVSFAYKIVT